MLSLCAGRFSVEGQQSVMGSIRGTALKGEYKIYSDRLNIF